MKRSTTRISPNAGRGACSIYSLLHGVYYFDHASDSLVTELKREFCEEMLKFLLPAFDDEEDPQALLNFFCRLVDIQANAILDNFNRYFPSPQSLSRDLREEAVRAAIL